MWPFFAKQLLETVRPLYTSLMYNVPNGQTQFKNLSAFALKGYKANKYSKKVLTTW